MGASSTVTKVILSSPHTVSPSVIFALNFLFSTLTLFVVFVCQGIAGAVTCVAPSPAELVSIARDRYARVHSTFPPPAEAGRPQDDKGTVLEKVYMKSIPTCVVWDGVMDEDGGDGNSGGDGDDDEDVWEGMQVAEDSEDESETRALRRRTGRK
jgi:ribosome biogenesis protein NSA1